MCRWKVLEWAVIHPMNKQDKRTFKNLLYEQFTRIGKALANSHRLELLDVLAQGERSVEALAHETGMSVANASHHLQLLRAAQVMVVFNDFGKSAHLPTGETVPVEFLPEKPGEYEFTCQMGMFRGKLIVK